MTTTHTESPPAGDPTLSERAADAVRQAADLAREARLLKSLAADAVEDGLHAAHRTITRARRTASDARDALTYRVKREPAKAMAVGFGLGALVGLGVGLLCRRGSRRRPTDGS